MTVAVDHLGIEYGEDRVITAPDGMSTREWVIEQAAQLREEKRQLERKREQLSKEQAYLDRTEEYLASATRNLSIAIRLVNDGTHNDEIVADAMADQPERFAVLKADATDGRPPHGFHARFWSLNNSKTSEPLSMPLKEAVQS